MNHIKILLFFTLLSVFGYSQTPGLNDVTNIVSTTAPNNPLYGQLETLKGEIRIRGNSTKYKDIDGSPYYQNTKEFLPGKLILPNEKLINVNIRYDIAAEEMQIQLEENQYQVLNNDFPVIIENSVFRKFRYLDSEGKYYLGYFKMKNHDSNANLLLLEKLRKEVRGTERNIARGFPPKFTDDSKFYLKFKSSGEAFYSETKTKNLVKSFPYKIQEQIENFINKNNLKPKKEEDLLKIIDYYNSAF
ncbi:hypothetical protein [Christiangramia echinicola]|uniref:hypothetical protein n=1 Tax=Christiangramia echinicola TaxID=279359 RepID=UPI0004113503|nr:hypothetical protein [Christiangramia echinicola]